MKNSAQFSSFTTYINMENNTFIYFYFRCNLFCPSPPPPPLTWYTYIKLVYRIKLELCDWLNSLTNETSPAELCSSSLNFCQAQAQTLWVWAELWTPYKFCKAKLKHSRLGSACCDYSLIYYLQWCKKSAFLSSRQARAELWISYYSCLSKFKHSILGSAWLDLSLIYYPHGCKLLWFLFFLLWFMCFWKYSL